MTDSEHRHVIYLPDGRIKFQWNDGSSMVIEGKRLTAADCEDTNCPGAGGNRG